MITIREVEDANRQGKILGVQCSDCNSKEVGIQAFCIQCNSSQLKTVELPTTGVIETYTVQYVAPDIFKNEAPYAVIVVKLEDGTRVTGRIPSLTDPTKVTIGSRVKAVNSASSGLCFQLL